MSIQKETKLHLRMPQASLHWHYFMSALFAKGALEEVKADKSLHFKCFILAEYTDRSLFYLAQSVFSKCEASMEFSFSIFFDDFLLFHQRKTMQN